MKKLIALAAASVLLAACDPYNDEPGGTPTVMYVWAGGYDVDTDGDGDADEATFYGVEDNTAPFAIAGADIATVSTSLAFIVKANVLLNGASIEAEPQTCVPAGDWLTVTGTTPTGGAWYTCYYPSTPTDTEPGGSIWIFYGNYTADEGVYSAPLETGYLNVAGTYTFSGTVETKDGDPLEIDFTATVI